jgi:hypothetical protein
MTENDDDDDVIDAIVDAIDRVLGVDDENSEQIDKIVTKTEGELRLCEDVVDNINFMNNSLLNEVIPSVERNMREIERMFAAVDSMERTVIPSLFADLEVIESVVDNIEKKVANIHKKAPSKSIWDRVGLGKSVFEPSAPKLSPAKPTSDDDFIPSDFPIHDQRLLLEEMTSALENNPHESSRR